MKIIYEGDIVEEPDEELGAMVVPPLVGVEVKPAKDSVHPILKQLENDIERQAEENEKKSPIEKNLISHFKTIQNKAIEIQREKEKEERK